MAKLAILGFGTVGSGVLLILRQSAALISQRLGQPLTAGYICDLRDFTGHEDAHLFVKDIEPILADKDVKVVVECIGGKDVAYQYVLKALKAGRHVVTSNKELVSAHGAQLIATAKENGVCFLFEASVGGGTPIINPMHQCLAANRIKSIFGIINGTTNFMLTRMEKAGLSFEEALAKAQKLGYAETIDPSFDLDGIDAGRKIAILASLAFGAHVHPQNVETRGIKGIKLEDMKVAKMQDCAIKLVAYAKKEPDGPLVVGVEPMMIARQSQLAGAEDVFNAVLIDTDMQGQVLFYGKGAGQLPTASAVLADAMQAIKEGAKIHTSLFWQPSLPVQGQFESLAGLGLYLRAKDGENAQKLRALPGAQPQTGSGGVILPKQGQKELACLLKQLKDSKVELEVMLKIWKGEN